MGFTGAVFDDTKLIDRSQLPRDARDIDVNAFLDLRIDYRSAGTLREQEDCMIADHQSVSWRTGDYDRAQKAFNFYLKLIRHNYNISEISVG